MDKLNANTHAKRAVYELRQRIINGDLPGGQRLYEVPLADELQISRTPIREALSRLAEEGLLERASGGGFSVRSFTLQDVVDAIELRGVLEGTAARLAAERGVSEDDLTAILDITQALDACFDQGTDHVDFDSYSELNASYHDALATLSGSKIVIHELERVKKLPFASPSAFVPEESQRGPFRRSLVVAQIQHRNLIGAIDAREGTRAEAICREHARIARGNLDFFMAQDGDMASPLPGLALVID